MSNHSGTKKKFKRDFINLFKSVVIRWIFNEVLFLLWSSCSIITFVFVTVMDLEYESFPDGVQLRRNLFSTTDYEPLSYYHKISFSSNYLFLLTGDHIYFRPSSENIEVARRKNIHSWQFSLSQSPVYFDNLCKRIVVS